MASSDLPMPTPTVPPKPFSSYKLLSFDIYGTLIDWETGIITRLEPLIRDLPSSHPLKDRLTLAARFNEHEAAVQTAHPGLVYSDLLEQVYLSLASELKLDSSTTPTLAADAKAFGSSVGQWPAFPDSVAAMHRLAAHYRFLIPLSNTDRKSFEGTLAGPLRGVPFTAYYLAEDIGSYKPNPENFRYLLDNAQKDYGVAKHEILHVAQSLFHDQVPAKTAGLASVWINRAGAGMGLHNSSPAQVHAENKVGYAWRFNTLGEFADAVDREFSSSSSS